jgi:hypothetical protein
MSGFNFPTAPKRNGPTGLELAAIGGLLQQRQQLSLQNQSLQIQQQILETQQVANRLVSSQLEQQAQIEMLRQREKILDLWRKEFEHQGLSPLEAHKQVETELELQDLIETAQNTYLGFENSCKSTEVNLMAQIVAEEIQKFRDELPGPKKFLPFLLPVGIILIILGTTHGSSAKFAYGMGVTGFAISIIGCLSWISRRNAILKFTQDLEIQLTPEQLHDSHVGERQALYREMQRLWLRLKDMPRSRLSDDSPFRKIVEDCVGMGKREFGNV